MKWQNTFAIFSLSTSLISYRIKLFETYQFVAGTFYHGRIIEHAWWWRRSAVKMFHVIVKWIRPWFFFLICFVLALVHVWCLITNKFRCKRRCFVNSCHWWKFYVLHFTEKCLNVCVRINRYIYENAFELESQIKTRNNTWRCYDKMWMKNSLKWASIRQNEFNILVSIGREMTEGKKHIPIWVYEWCICVCLQS